MEGRMIRRRATGAAIEKHRMLTFQLKRRRELHNNNASKHTAEELDSVHFR